MKILQPDNNNKNNKFTAMKAASKAMKMAIKAAIMKLFSLVLMVLLKFWYIILILVTLAVLFDFIIEIVTAKSTPDKIIEELEVEEIADLVEIKSSDGGYYLDFKEGIDEKLDEIVEGMNSTAGVHNLPKNKEFLKKLIKAEAITQFPDLGGEIPEGTDGFQGSVKIRRVSPNKDVGEMKNTGKGETSAIEKDTVYDTIQNGNYDEILKTWQAGKKLTIKSDAKVYKQTESELDPGSDTGNWEEVYDEKTSGTLEIKEGTTVEYTGTYKNNTNPLSKEVVTYVEVKTEDITGYVKAGYLAEAINSTAKVEEKKKIEISSRAETRANKAIGDADKTYTIAIAAGHNNSSDKGVHANGLVEEDLTIEVAEEVEELLNQYSNVKVVQTGSTKSNPGGIKAEERAKITRNANPDLCIQIYFGSGSTGVQTIYRDGDGISSQLADVLAETISASMGLENKKAGTDIEKCDSKSLGIIDNAATSEYPSVVTEGGSLNSINDVEILKEDGVEKYAKGIVDGIEKYYTLDHSGYTSTEISEQTSTDSVESLVKNLKYVPYDTMKSYIEEGNNQALNVFSIDEENNLVTATWSKKEDGTTEIKENAPVNLKSTLEKYIMPYEYLLYFYIDTNETGFSEDLADKIINDTEIVIAVQDNVTTTETTTTLQERREDEKEGKSYDWKDGSKTTKITETCSTTVGITYVNTWCVKAYQDNSYSSEVLDMGDNESKVINIKGKVTESKYQSLTDEEVVDEGTYSEQIQETNRETGEIETKTVTYKYKVYNRDKIDTRTISNRYEQGELKTEGKENTFVKAYQANNMQNWVRTEYLFKIMENNERTKNMLDLTKYLMFKATNINYGKVEFDFSEFELSSFTNIDGYYGDWDGTGSQEDFINAVAPYAVMDMEKYEIYASVTIAQAIIESGWGKDNIAIQYKNFFGMKVGGGTPNEYWSGNSVNLNASEGGTSYFRVYDSLGNSIHDHGRNFIVTSTYRAHGVLDCVSQNLGPKEQLKRIAQSGYAVDGNGNITKPDGRRTYDQYLYEEFIQKYNLERFDSMSSSDFQVSGNTNIIETARTKLGCAYVWGATGPNTFDCSGLVMWVYQQNGITVPRTTSQYKPYIGTDKEVSWEEAQPGDIVWREGHMGIYLGNDKYIHAPQTGDVVKESSGAKKSFTNVFRFY